MSDVPAVIGDGQGAVMALGGKYVRNMVLTVADMMGGAQGLYEWAVSTNDRKDQFYTKLLPKVITREVDLGVTKGVEDLLAQLDGGVVEGSFTEVAADAANLVDEADENLEDYE